MAAEHIRHWRVGDVEIARIVEVYGFEDDIAMLLPDATPQYLQQFGWLVPHFATPEGRMIISFQCFVLRSKGRTVMIDTCIGNDRKREFDVFCNMQNTFLEDLSSAGFPAGEVTDVLHASALRSRGLEYPARRGPLGADLSPGALPLRAQRMAELEAAARHRRVQSHGPSAGFHRPDTGRGPGAIHRCGFPPHR